MTRSLPARPSLARLRDQARALQRGCRVAEPVALARLAAVFPDMAEPRLAKAQAVIAREYGFPSWPKLKAHVEATLARIFSVAEVLAERWFALAEAGDLAALNRLLSVGKGRLEAARDLMRRDPIRYQGFVQTLISGLADRRARIRFECAHDLDIFGDAACRPYLVPLMEDLVPRVRAVLSRLRREAGCDGGAHPRPDRAGRGGGSQHQGAPPRGGRARTGGRGRRCASLEHTGPDRCGYEGAPQRRMGLEADARRRERSEVRLLVRAILTSWASGCT